jgi:ssDNA-binding Zn-finger/Zn-ribbon topoisomerase 1
MPDPLWTILVRADEVAKENLTPPVACPACGERDCIIKHGFYQRYTFTGEDLTRIQRFRCLNRRCPRCTFSCLPHPFLPIMRLPLCALWAIVAMVEKDSATIAAVARAWRKTWITAKRALACARRLRRWIAAEAPAAAWAPSPCLNPARQWGTFVRSLSFAFYPARC